VIVGVVLVSRMRRRRAQEREVHEAGEESAGTELVALGEEIRALDLDTSMPNAPRAALAEYEQAIARYGQANELLEGDPTAYRVEQAQAAIAAGKRHIAAARPFFTSPRAMPDPMIPSPSTATFMTISMFLVACCGTVTETRGSEHVCAPLRVLHCAIAAASQVVTLPD
jgi:hypothetical protein